MESKNLSDESSPCLERDPLTGLYHRNAFFQQLRLFFSTIQPKDWCIASIDIEHFKLYNDWYGQKAGDTLLSRISSYLKHLETAHHYVAGYFGNDDFFLCMPYHKELIHMVYETVANYIEVQESGDGFLPSIGIYVITDFSVEINTMCNNAQIACQSNKGNFDQRICVFKDNMVEDIEKRQRLLFDVNTAIQDKEFQFYLQPKCNTITRRIVSMEALVRWIHPTRGFISPGEFIPLLEQSGLITRLDMYIWDAVCQMLHRWKETGRHMVPISVNVSISDITHTNVPEYLSSLLHQYQLDPKLLLVEITESMFAENQLLLEQTISEFHNRGFSVLMDDFGSGYSSLNMLKDTSVDVLKLDMKFINMDAENQNKALQILESIINMAHRLNMPIIVEGVETAEQVSLLQSMNCLYAQGYYFYKPMPVADAEKLLAQPTTESYWDIQQDLAERSRHLVDLAQTANPSYGSAPSVLQILTDHLLEAGQWNLVTGEYRQMKRYPMLSETFVDVQTSFLSYNSQMIEEGWIHPDDASAYLKATSLEHVREQFLTGTHYLVTRCRKKLSSGFVQSTTLLLPCHACSVKNPWAAVFSWESELAHTSDLFTAPSQDTNT